MVGRVSLLFEVKGRDLELPFLIIYIYKKKTVSYSTIIIIICICLLFWELGLFTNNSKTALTWSQQGNLEVSIATTASEPCTESSLAFALRKLRNMSYLPSTRDKVP